MVAGVLTGCGGSSSDNSSSAGSDAAETQTTGNADGFTIGFSLGYWGNTWRSQTLQDFEDRANEYKEEGILADYMVANTSGDASEQLNQLNAMIDAKVDALMINPASPTAIKPAIDKALAGGIKVIIFDNPAAFENTYCVAGDNYTWQKIQDEWLCAQLGGKGNIVKITGVAGNSCSQLREQADDDVLANYPDISVLASTPGNWSETDAQSIMTTYLSSFDNIDGVLLQDVMAEGVLQAYENAGKEPKIMIGDYTKSFFLKWKENSELNTIGCSYAPGISRVALDFTVNLLQGMEVDEDQLLPNPMDESLVNTLMFAPPYVVTNEGDQNAPWMEGLNNTKAITVDEALEILGDAADTAALDGWMEKEAVDAWFK